MTTNKHYLQISTQVDPMAMFTKLIKDSVRYEIYKTMNMITSKKINIYSQGYTIVIFIGILSTRTPHNKCCANKATCISRINNCLYKTLLTIVKCNTNSYDLVSHGQQPAHITPRVALSPRQNCSFK